MQGLSYDRYNNTIKVDGDDNVIILVDGLEKNQEYIRGLDPERLKKVEIIRDPSGRYAIEGYSAVINVILKKDYSGSEINISNMAIIDTDSKKEAFLPMNYLSLGYNYTYNKLNFYVQARNSYNYFNMQSTERKEFDNGLIIEKKPFEGDRNTLMKHFSNNYTVGVDYYINPKHTLSFESNLKTLPLASNINEHRFKVASIENGITTIDTTESKKNSKNKNFTNSIFYIYKINGKNTLNADFTHTNYTDNFTNNFFNSNGYTGNEKGVNKKHYTKFYLEYEHVFNNNSAIIAGYGNTWKKLDNTYKHGFDLSSENGILKDTNFVFTDIRHKLYAYFSSKIGKKLSFKIGIAGEYSKPKVGNTGKVFMIYQPHFDFKIDVHKYLDIKLKYRSHSNYPNISQASPIPSIIDQHTSSVGNPYLKPETNHNISLKFSTIQNAVSFEPYYNFSDNRINRVINFTDTDTLQYGYDNVGQYVNQGFKGNITIPFFKRSLILRSSFNFFKSKMSYKEKSHSFKDWTINGQLIYINQKHELYAGLIYQKNLRKYINAQGYSSGNVDMWMLFIQKSFIKSKLNVMLGYMLPVNLGTNYEQKNYTDTGTYKEISTINTGLLKNIVMLRLSYRFNKGKSIRKSKKDIEQEVEKESKSLF